MSHSKKPLSPENISLDSKISQFSNNFGDHKEANDSKISKNPNKLNFLYEVKTIFHISPYPNFPKKIKALGQFLGRYIIAENDEELVCFDQKLFIEKSGEYKVSSAEFILDKI